MMAKRMASHVDTVAMSPDWGPPTTSVLTSGAAAVSSISGTVVGVGRAGLTVVGGVMGAAPAASSSSSSVSEVGWFPS